MKRVKLLSTLLFVGAIALNANQGAFADTTASQTVTGTLGLCRKIEANGGNIASDIQCTDGALLTAFAPAFKITTNSANSQVVAMKAECNTSGGLVNALSGDGETGSTYISLTTAGETGLPAALAVTNAQSGAPTPATNANVITYGITKPNLPAGLTYTDFTGNQWNMAVAKKGETVTYVTVPATTPKASTYSYDDEPGAYQATVTLSFV